MRTHLVEIAGLRRELPIVTVTPSVAIAFLKLYGDAELVEAAAPALAESLDPSCEFILGPEAGGIVLAHLLAVRADLPYAIARKKQRPNMTAPARVQLRSIGTDGWQTGGSRRRSDQLGRHHRRTAGIGGPDRRNSDPATSGGYGGKAAGGRDDAVSPAAVSRRLSTPRSREE